MQLAVLEAPEARHDDRVWRTQAMTCSVSCSLAIRSMRVTLVEEEVVGRLPVYASHLFMTTETVNPASLDYFAEGMKQHGRGDDRLPGKSPLHVAARVGEKLGTDRQCHRLVTQCSG